MKLPSPDLEDKDKSKLIEILLIVGAILGVLKPNDYMLPFFLLFLLFSILFYISLHSKPWRRMWFYSSIIVSLTFSGVVSSILGVAMINSGIRMAFFIALLYYGVFSYILFRALYK